MEEIKRQVGRAQRRLIGQQFLSIVVWSLFATLLIGAIGLAIPKIWALPIKHDVWTYAWLGGSFGIGLVVALVWTYLVRRSAIDAAIELDRRYGLKERVSSTLALSEEERLSEVGKALVADAIRKVERVDVREQFNIQPSWRFALPLVPAAIITGLLFLPNASLENKAAANNQTPTDLKKAITKQAVKMQQILRKDQKKDKTEEELKTEQALKEIAKKFNELAQNDKLDKKEMQIKISDLAKDVQKRQEELGGAKEMKKQLDKLGKIEKGPADKLADAMKEGDFKKAQEQLNQLKDDLKNGKLDDKAKEEIAKQMEQLKDKIKQMAQDAKEARQKLEQEIANKLEKGDLDGAAKLQDKLDQMNKQGKQAEDMMNKLAEKLGQCAKCMKEGGNMDPKEAGQKLDALAKALKDAEDQLEQMEDLDEMLDQLADAKNAMNGKEGKGDKPGDLEGDNDGMGNKGNKNGRPGRGLGAGRGFGDRPESEVDTKTYDAKANAKVKAGESIRTGDAGGANMKGKTLQEAKAELQSAADRDPDALNELNLPRELRDHTTDYFKKFRKGEK
jgi:hypothetical protein